MFDFGIGYTEMFVVAVVAVIVIGPKDLPRVLRSIGKMVAKMRGMAREFQGHLDSALKETGLDEVKKEFNNLKNAGGILEPVDPKKFAADEAAKQTKDYKRYFADVPAANAPRTSSGAAPEQAAS